MIGGSDPDPHNSNTVYKINVTKLNKDSNVTWQESRFHAKLPQYAIIIKNDSLLQRLLSSLISHRNVCFHSSHFSFCS